MSLILTTMPFPRTDTNPGYEDFDDGNEIPSRSDRPGRVDFRGDKIGHEAAKSNHQEATALKRLREQASILKIEQAESMDFPSLSQAITSCVSEIEKAIPVGTIVESTFNNKRFRILTKILHDPREGLYVESLDLEQGRRVRTFIQLFSDKQFTVVSSESDNTVAAEHPEMALRNRILTRLQELFRDSLVDFNTLPTHARTLAKKLQKRKNLTERVIAFEIDKIAEKLRQRF